MVTTTTTYSLKKPTVGQDEDLWGGYLNDSMDLIDDVLDGTTPVTGIDINSGTLDNVTINSSAIGGTTAAAGTFTTLSATTSLGVTGNITVSGTVDGRDVAADGTKLDGIESGATADQTKADIDALGIAASTAATLATARNIALSGDVSGSASFNGSANISITATVADDSHNHVISNVDGLQTALDGKLSTSGTAANSQLLDSLDSTQFLRSDAADTTTGELTVGAGQDRQLVLNRNVATPSNYYSGLQQEIRATSGTAGIGLHRNGYSHVGIYHDASDTLKFNMNSGTVTMGATAGTLWGSGNDGAGSGLDADLWDGNQFSNYLNQALLTNSNVTFNRVTGSDYIYSPNMYLDTALYHNGDLDTFFRFGNNYAEIYAGNSQSLYVDANGAYVTDGSLREDYDALSGTSPTCNVNSGGAFSLTMSGNTTFTFTSPSSGYSTGFVLQLTGNGSTVTWPASVDWAGGTAPDAPASGETDILVFWTRDGGTTWYGALTIDAAS